MAGCFEAIQRCMRPTAVAQPIPTFTTDSVPYHVSVLFDRWDLDHDGRLTLEEWKKALKKEFPNLPQYAKDEVPRIFAKYAQTVSEGGIDWQFVDKFHFSKLYAAFLFRNFDADNNGYLDVHECEKALEYLTEGRPIAVALRPEWSEVTVKIGKPAFWAMYKQMMDE